MTQNYGGPEMQAYIDKRERLVRLAEKVKKDLEDNPFLIADIFALPEDEKDRIFNEALDRTTHWTLDDLFMRLD